MSSSTSNSDVVESGVSEAPAPPPAPPTISRRGPARVVGIELGDTGMRAVELLRKGERLVVGPRTELYFEDGEERATQLQRGLIKAGITAKHAVVSVPRHLVILRELMLPATERAELEQMAALRMERELPFPADEMASALSSLEETGDGSRVLAAYVKREHLQRQLDVVRGAELEIIGAGVSALLALQALRVVRAFDGRPHALVVPGPARTEIGAIDRSASALSRTAFIGFGGLDFDAGPDAVGNARFLDELERTFTSFHAGKDPIERIALADAGERTGPLTALLRTRFDVPVEVLHPFDSPLYERPDASPAEDDSRYAIAAGAALAAVLERTGGSVDFIPPEPTLLERLKLDKRWIWIGAAIAALLAIYVLPPMVFARMDEDVRMLTGEQAELRKVGKELAKHREKFEMMDPWAGGRTRWLDAWLAIQRIVDNKRCIVSSVKFNDTKGSITLAGKGKTSTDCTTLAKQLDAHPAFAARLKGTNSVRGFQGFKISFTIDLTLDRKKLGPLGKGIEDKKKKKGGK